MEAIILAAGKGSRMKVDKPKVLVEVEGKTIIRRIVDALDNKYTLRKIIVVGDNFQEIQNELTGNITYAFQNVPLGTLDAYIQALPYISSKEVIVIPGDIPFIDDIMINDIISYYYQNNIRNLVIGMKVLNPTSYGRIIKDTKIQIVEEKNCTIEQQKINTINTGIYIFNVEDIYPYLPSSSINKETNEYYLTDYINYLSDKKLLSTLIFPENYKLKGANDIKTLNEIIIESQNENTYKKIIKINTKN